MKYKREFIIAIDKLIKAYELKIKYNAVCPLCIVAGENTVVKADCNICPWVIFEGVNCACNNYGRHSFPIRIQRLKRWREKIIGMDRRLKDV